MPDDAKDPDTGHDEINPEDQEEEIEGDIDCTEEDVDLDLDLGGDVPSDKRKGAECTVALWPFAKPLQHWSMLLDQVAHVSSAKYLVYISRTAHPGLAVAARAAGLQVLGLVQGARNHCQRHATSLLRQMMMQLKMTEVKKTEQGVKRAGNFGGLSFISATVPANELTLVKEVALPSAWPSGLNLYPDCLEDKCIDLVHREMEAFKLAFMDTQYGKGLQTTKAYRDGDIVMYASALWFEETSLLKHFLARPGNSAFLDRNLSVDGAAVL